ncbi:MAG: hypothetical protein CSA75_00055 [Sorangium cellulosum]|nr:MAG: hypothetical protein CSA75_00055 [Sorangium cellulosum]
MAFKFLEGSHWWALRTKANFEKTVASQLNARKFDAFLPTYRTLSKRTDRRKIVFLPLFSGYVFVQANLSIYENRLTILQTRGMVNIVGGPDGPLPVKPQEIENVRLLCDSKRMLEPWNKLEVGKPVRIVSGGLAGVTGVIVDIKGAGKRLVCNVNLLNRAVAAELQTDEVEPMSRSDHID